MHIIGLILITLFTVSDPGLPYDYQLKFFKAFIDMKSGPDWNNQRLESSKGRVGRFRITSELRFTPKDDSVYVYLRDAYTVNAVDEFGEQIVRPNERDNKPAISFDWILPNGFGAVEEYGKSYAEIKTSNKCIAIPGNLSELRIKLPVWKVSRSERITVPVQESAEWKELPNGERVKVELNKEWYLGPNLRIYRDHVLDSTGLTTPPAFQLLYLLDEKGEVMRVDGSPSNFGLLPANPEDSLTARVAGLGILFRSREPEFPTHVVLNVVHEYVREDVNFRLEDFALGRAEPDNRP